MPADAAGRTSSRGRLRRSWPWSWPDELDHDHGHVYDHDHGHVYGRRAEAGGRATVDSTIVLSAGLGSGPMTAIAVRVEMLW